MPFIDWSISSKVKLSRSSSSCTALWEDDFCEAVDWDEGLAWESFTPPLGAKTHKYASRLASRGAKCSFINFVSYQQATEDNVQQDAAYEIANLIPASTVSVKCYTH